MRNIGDTVFIAWGSAHHSVEKKCSICFGRREVHIILGDGSRVAVQCGGCGRGYEGPTGISMAYEAHVGVQKAEVSGIEKRGDGFRYSFSPSPGDILGVFDTEEDAALAAAKALPGLEAYRDQADAGVTQDKWDSSTWSVYYHRSQIRRAKKTLEWHETQIREVK
ncbi:MAG: hypothetical protein V3S83_12440 [Gemmatimonadota bacterium]